jgi:hypothetical protein
MPNMGVIMVRRLLPLVALCLLSLLLVASIPSGPYGFLISNEVHGAPDEIAPALTYNSGFMRTYAAVWQRNTTGSNTYIYARLVDWNGQLNGNPVRVSPFFGTNVDPDIVYNPDNDQYLVVYARTTTGIYGRVLNNTLSTVGSEIIIAEGAGSYASPAVAYSTGSGSYLVTWTLSGGGVQGIQARAVTNTGTVVPTLLDVSGLNTRAPAFSDVAWSAPLNRFLVVWQMIAPLRTDMNVYGQVVGLSAGTLVPVPIGTTLTIFDNSNHEDELNPAVGSTTETGGSGQFLVTTEAYYSGGPLIDGQLIVDNGSFDGSRLFISDGSGYRPAVAGKNSSHSYLVAWNDSSAAMSACIVYPDGFSDPISTNTTVNGVSNVAAASGSGGSFLIAADGMINPSTTRDIFGYLQANWFFLPLIMR